jgi:hypothetical protein
MTMDYLSTIKPFALQVFDPFNQPTKKWKWVKSLNVLRSLLRLLDNPDGVYQSCFGLCGQSAFIRVWAYRDPVAVANFTLALFKNGTAKIGNASWPNGDFDVSPKNDLLWCSWMDRPDVPDKTGADFRSYADWGVGNPITESVWMITGSLANITKNSIAVIAGMFVPGQPSEFDGEPASDVWTLALPENIENWMRKTGCYTKGSQTNVVNNTDVLKNTRVNPNKSLESDTFLESNFSDQYDDVILCINTNMLYNAIDVTPNDRMLGPSQFKTFPDHYVMLTRPITQSSDVVTLHIWSWGGYYEVKVSHQVFNDNYFGYIWGHSDSPRRPLNLAPLSYSAIQNQRIYFDQNHVLHFNWESADARVEWFELQRIGASGIQNQALFGTMTVRDILQRVWPTPGTGAYQITLDNSYWTDPADTLYDLVACNGILKPYDCDPANYNHYGDAQCNKKQGYQYAGSKCQSHTTNCLINYDQAARALQADTTISYAGETVGYCHADGRMEIVVTNATIQVGNKPGTPVQVQKIAVWMEYFHQLLSTGSYALSWMMGGLQGIDLTLENGFMASISPEGVPCLTIDPATADADLPGVCLKALLMLEFAKTGSWPEWIFPTFLSQVGVVQVPSMVTPDGFENFYSSYKQCECLRVYDADWSTLPNSRQLQIAETKPCNPNLTGVVFMQFDKPVQANSVQLRLTGQTPDGKSANIPVVVTPSPDGSYYYGSFQPVNSWGSNYGLQLQVQANRSWSNGVLRTLVGDGMDANPATIASVDPHSAQKLAFRYADAGSDLNHTILIGQPGLYARINSLAPDQFDQAAGNNSFSTATKISLVVADAPHENGVSSSDRKSYSALNFHNQQDVDYFDVSYQCPASDDTDAANRSRNSSNNNYLGLSSTHLPPVLSCLVVPADCRCMDVVVYKCDALGRSLVISEAKSMGISMDSPSLTLGAKEGYFVIQNHDPASQGAFTYNLQVTYSSAYDSLTVDTGAPAYSQDMSTVRRKVLGKLYSRIDLPRPPEDGAQVIQIQDVARFVQGFEKFLIDPQAAKLIGQFNKTDGRATVAEGLYFLGQVAQAYGRYEDAQRIYTESARRYSRQGDKAKAIGVLESLAGVYEKNGKTSMLSKVRKEIRAAQRSISALPAGGLPAPAQIKH